MLALSAGTYALQAQTISIVNNTTRDHIVAIDAMSGGFANLSDQIFVTASANIGPFNVDTYWNTVSGTPLPGTGSYVWHVHLEGDCGGFDLDVNNTSFVGCPGTADEFTATFIFDPFTKDAVLKIN